MKFKFAVCIAAVLLSSTGLYAQKSMKYFVSLQGGAALSLNENFQAYFAEHRRGGLFTLEGSISVGKYFSDHYGARISFESSDNAGAANYQESFKHFRPYKFRSAIGFVDFIMNAGDQSVAKVCNFRFFAGLGYAYSYDFRKETDVPWWSGLDTGPNHSFGMRAGMILEFYVPGDIGIFFEPCFEMFTDRYNGIAPVASAGQKLGFPFDCKLNNSLGIVFHF